MNEKERELRQKMAAKNEEIRGLMNEGKLDDAEQATEELRRLKRELQVEIIAIYSKNPKKSEFSWRAIKIKTK